MMESLRTARDVARLASVPRTLVHRSARDGSLASIRIGRTRRFRAVDVETWLARQLLAELQRRGHEPAHIEQANVTSVTRWAGRLVGLWRDDHGRPKTLWARTIVAETTEPRYLYLQGARRPVTPYGLHEVLLGSSVARPGTLWDVVPGR